MSARVFDCPSCGATLKFHSSVAVFAVCEFCRSMVVRRDASIETLGTMAELPPDLSPLQVGTTGVWKGESFQLIGRIRLEWDQGSWTEWCAEFPNDRIGWVAEAQGYYMVTSEITPEDALPRKAKEYQVGTVVYMAGRQWSVVDVKSARCISVEGELPFSSPPSSTRRSVDLASENQGFATIELSPEGVAAFVGDYAAFDALQFSNLRPVPGWDADVPAERNKTVTLNCPNCGAPVNLRAAGQTMSIVCGSCGSVIDTANPQAKLVQEADETIAKLKLVLPIGTRGLFRGTQYEVIGFQRRNDPWASWDEYLLFNPWQGFRWLVTFRGHWSFVSPLLEQPLARGNEMRLSDGRVFQLYGRAPVETTAVLGEFYWKVKRGEAVQMGDYVQPPFILSMEKYADLAEVTWSTGVYVEHSDVAKAFNVPKLYPPNGVYLNQPNPHLERLKGVRWKAFLALIIYIAIQFIFIFRGGKHDVYSGSFNYTRDPATPQSALSLEREAPARVITSPRFTIRQDAKPVWFRANAPVDNSWMSLEVDLVNVKTNQTFSVPIGIEFYSGTEGGESWTEGSKSADDSLPGVPAGEYLMNIEVTADPKITQMPFSIAVRSGGLFWSNFWLGLGLLAIYPLWVKLRSRAFEMKRWSESDYSPYATAEDDE